MFATQANQLPSNRQLVSILAEAEDYLSVKPSRSLQLLSKPNDLSILTEDEFFRWHITIIRSALPLNKLSLVEHSLSTLFKHAHSHEFNRRIVPILSALGIWLRRSNYLEEAKLALLCSLSHNNIRQNKVRLLISLAIVSKHLAQKSEASQIYNLARTIAEQDQLTSLLATIENNIGVLALENGDLLAAEQRFRKALARYQAHSNRSGNIVSGLNLLQVFLIQNQSQNFQRLYPSIARLTQSFPNNSKKNNLKFLKTIFDIQQSDIISIEAKKLLANSYQQITEQSVQLSLHQYFAKTYALDLKQPKQFINKKLQSPWFTKIPQCNWHELKEFDIETLK